MRAAFVLLRVAALGVVFMPTHAPAAVLHDWSLDELVRRADRIVVGRVSRQTPAYADGRLVTESTVVVERTLLGSAQPELRLTQLGGRIGDRQERWDGEPLLETGARLLLITYTHTDGRTYLVGMAQGLIHLADADDRGRQQIDATLVDAAGRARPGGVRLISITEVEVAVRRRETSAAATGENRRGRREGHRDGTRGEH